MGRKEKKQEVATKKASDFIWAVVTRVDMFGPKAQGPCTHWSDGQSGKKWLNLIYAATAHI